MIRRTTALAGLVVALGACGGGDGRSDSEKARAVVAELRAEGFYDEYPDVTENPTKLADAFGENCDLDGGSLEYYVAETFDDGDEWILEVARAYRTEFCPDRVDDLDDAIDYILSL